MQEKKERKTGGGKTSEAGKGVAWTITRRSNRQHIETEKRNLLTLRKLASTPNQSKARPEASEEERGAAIGEGRTFLTEIILSE